MQCDIFAEDWFRNFLLISKSMSNKFYDIYILIIVTYKYILYIFYDNDIIWDWT